MTPARRKPRRPRPILFVRVDNYMAPLPRFQRVFDERFEVNGEYALIESEERNMSQHRGYFAQVRDAWKNLAEAFDGRFPSAEHLRAHALVEAGYCAETDYVMDSPKEARKLAVDLRRMNPYSIIKLSGNVVKHFEPDSQSVPAMSKERFQASCRAVLEIVASMARTTPAELKKNAGRAA